MAFKVTWPEPRNMIFEELVPRATVPLRVKAFPPVLIVRFVVPEF
jgi:hypothetical protein